MWKDSHQECYLHYNEEAMRRTKIGSKISDSFVEKLFTKEGETVEEAKEGLRGSDK